MRPGRSVPVCHLVKIYKVDELEVFALQGLDLEIRRGEVMAIIGASGSGKSTLLNVLGGLDAPTAGRAFSAGWNLLRMSRRDRIRYKRRTVGFVWQNVTRNLVPYLSALENVELPMVLNGRFNRKRAVELLAAVDLDKRMRHTPRHMSGGEQQRVAIAIAMANNPSLLLADEPTGSLDSKTGATVLSVFNQIRDLYGVTVVIVTHDHGIANAVDRWVEIRDGKTSSEAVRRSGEDAAGDSHDRIYLARLGRPPATARLVHRKSGAAGSGSDETDRGRPAHRDRAAGGRRDESFLSRCVRCLPVNFRRGFACNFVCHTRCGK